ncbi:MAG: PEP-CTERM sorting domain-containing protein, partial [Luteitalea sp.]
KRCAGSIPAPGTQTRPRSSTLTTFTGLADGTDVNNLVVDGILFQYSLGNGLVIDGGPGTTNNVAVPNIVSVGNPTGVLSVTLPTLVGSFGYGFAVLLTTPIGTATTISLFNDSTAVGSLSYSGTPDPTFSGGFAGIQSTLLFNRAELTFTGAAPAFALDNIRTSLRPVPEPGLLLLIGAGLVGAVVRRRRL